MNDQLLVIVLFLVRVLHHIFEKRKEVGLTPVKRWCGGGIVGKQEGKQEK